MRFGLRLLISFCLRSTTLPDLFFCFRFDYRQHNNDFLFWLQPWFNLGSALRSAFCFSTGFSGFSFSNLTQVQAPEFSYLFLNYNYFRLIYDYFSLPSSLLFRSLNLDFLLLFFFQPSSSFSAAFCNNYIYLSTESLWLHLFLSFFYCSTSFLLFSLIFAYPLDPCTAAAV